MMTKDNQTLDNGVATIARAGADAVTAKDRIVEVEATYGDVTVTVPYLFDGCGSPRPCEIAMGLAKDLYDRDHPTRRGYYEMDDIASLVTWGKRFAVADTTAVFIEAPSDGEGKVIVVVDELQQGAADGARRQLKCELKLRLHERLLVWLGASQKPMTVDAFSDFAQRATDEFADASLISAIANVEVHEESKWARSVDPDTLAVRLTAETTKKTTKVPSVFKFAVPVFDGDDEQNAQTFTARLTIKAPNGKPQFSFEVVDFKPRLAEAMATIRQQMLAVTPNVYMGSPG